VSDIPDEELLQNDTILADCIHAAFGGITHPHPPPTMTTDQIDRALTAFRVMWETNVAIKEKLSESDSGASHDV